MTTTALKARVARAKAIVRREDGGIDLPSTMVSILVIAAFLAAAALAVFVVIPWAQNNAAKQLVSQVATAQSTYYSMSGDGTMSTASPANDPQYASIKDLVDEGLLSGFTAPVHTASGTGALAIQTSIDDKTKLQIITSNATSTTSATPTLKDTFIVKVRSDTGKVYQATHADPQPADGSW